MPQPDFQAFADAYQPAQQQLAGAQSAAAMRQMAAQYLAGSQIANGNMQGGVKTLYASGDIPDAQQEQVFGNTTAGATAMANRDYQGAASSFGQAGSVSGVQTAQQGQMAQYQMLGSYLKNAMPVYQAAYQHNGPAGLAHAVQETGSELAQAGLISPQAVQGYVQQAQNDPDGFMSSINNFVQQVSYQKVSNDTSVMTDPWGRPIGVVTGQTQATLTAPNGSQTEVTTPPSISGIGASAPSAVTAGAGTGQATQGSPASPLAAAIFAQESSMGANPKTSANGAVGPMQIMPSTFNRYMHPGENINNPADNIAVGNRIVGALQAMYPNDPARVAVAYFSGPGNVAPAGSPTPWVNDLADGNGVKVSQYVPQVLARLGATQGSSAAPAAPVATAPGTQITATTDNGQPAFRDATPAEAAAHGYATGQFDAKGQFHGIAALGDVNNLSPQALQQGAEQYRLTGQLPNFGRSQGAAVAYEQMKNMAAAEDAAAGISPPQRQVMQATYGAAQKSNQQLIPQLSAMQAYERTTLDDFANVERMAQAGAGNAGIKTGNDLQNFIREEFGDQALGQYKIFLNDANSNYSKLVLGSGTGSGGAPGSASEREDNAELFSENDPPATILAKINAMKLGMGNRTKEIAAQVQMNNQIMMSGGLNPGASQSASPAAGTSAPAPQQSFAVGQTATGPGGAKIRWDGQQWQPVQTAPSASQAPGQTAQNTAASYLGNPVLH